jgi:hypothetical protein
MKPVILAILNFAPSSPGLGCNLDLHGYWLMLKSFNSFHDWTLELNVEPK